MSAKGRRHMPLSGGASGAVKRARPNALGARKQRKRISVLMRCDAQNGIGIETNATCPTVGLLIATAAFGIRR